MLNDAILEENPSISVREYQFQIRELKKKNTRLSSEVERLKHQLKWFQQQMFGAKTERRLIASEAQPLLDLFDESDIIPETEIKKKKITYERGKAPKKRDADCLTTEGLRFNDDVSVTVVEILPEALKEGNPDEYDVIDTKVTHRVAQRVSSYEVIEYRMPVLKRKEDQQLFTGSRPNEVLEKSMADVSLLAGMLVDKFAYHIPLYRQHQRISTAGITLSRASLTNWAQRTIGLLRPIVKAQLESILAGDIIAMDETPIKASRKPGTKGKPGKMKQGYFWPIYGERDEVVFTYSSTRAMNHVTNALKDFTKGTLLTDGYSAYERFANKQESINHATCWSHGRRKFIAAENSHPEEAAHAIGLIGQLYELEEKAKVNEEKLRQYRLEKMKPIVDAFYLWCMHQANRTDLPPKDPLRTAVQYMLKREHSMRAFLGNLDIPLDTNHLERTIRSIAMGRKNWLFCWTELGAEYVGVIQSLISTCKLHNINPYHYLVDVLQRVSIHPASLVHELTPRIWKEKFASNPLRSDLDQNNTS